MRTDVTYIYFKKDGESKRWGITAAPFVETVESLRRHLEIWIPDAEFEKAEYFQLNPDGKTVTVWLFTDAGLIQTGTRPLESGSIMAAKKNRPGREFSE